MATCKALGLDRITVAFSTLHETACETDVLTPSSWVRLITEDTLRAYVHFVYTRVIQDLIKYKYLKLLA